MEIRHDEPNNMFANLAQQHLQRRAHCLRVAGDSHYGRSFLGGYHDGHADLPRTPRRDRPLAALARPPIEAARCDLRTGSMVAVSHRV